MCTLWPQEGWLFSYSAPSPVVLPDSAGKIRENIFFYTSIILKFLYWLLFRNSFYTCCLLIFLSIFYFTLTVFLQYLICWISFILISYLNSFFLTSFLCILFFYASILLFLPNCLLFLILSTLLYLLAFFLFLISYLLFFLHHLSFYWISIFYGIGRLWNRVSWF